MKMFKAGSRGFTLLELLAVIALMGILSFSVFYGFKGRGEEPLRAGQEILEKAIKSAQRLGILSRGSRLMVLNNPQSKDHNRLITIGLREEGVWKGSEIYVKLPEGMEVVFINSGQVSDNEGLWNYIELGGTESHRMELVLLEDRKQKVVLIVNEVGVVNG